MKPNERCRHGHTVHFAELILPKTDFRPGAYQWPARVVVSSAPSWQVCHCEKCLRRKAVRHE
jgi:hypothetical protein